MAEEVDDGSDLKLKDRQKQFVSRMTTLVLLVPCGILALVIGSDTSDAEGWAVFSASGSVTMIVRVFWENRAYRWYWGTVVLLTLIHILLIMLIPWPAHYATGKGDEIFVVLDFAITFGIVTLAARLFRAPEKLGTG